MQAPVITPSISFFCQDIDKITPFQYTLLVELGKYAASLAMYDHSSNEYVAVEQLNFKFSNRENDYLGVFEEYFSNSFFKGINYKNIAVLWSADLFSIVPHPLFDGTNLKSYLKISTGYTGKQEILTQYESSIDSHFIYAVDSRAKKSIENIFPGSGIHHYNASLINALLSDYKNEQQTTMVAHIQNGHFELAIIDNRKLKYFNRFEYTTSEDVAYYVLFVCETLKISPEEIEFKLAGEIEKKSEIYNLLYKYIRNINLVTRGNKYKLAGELQSLPGHYFYNLFNAINCVS